MAVVAYLFVAVMTATTLPTPLYPIYAERLGLKPVQITLIYATYAVGVLAALLVFGRLSDAVGRRPVLVAALVVSALSAVFFVSGVSLPLLYTGRVISGISAGLVTGAATAYLTELDPVEGRGGLIAASVNLFGLGVGPLLAGVVSTHLGAPTRTPYLIAAALLVPALLVLGVPSTGSTGRWRAALRPQRLGVPEQMRTPFVAAAISGVVAFAFLGFLTSLVGDLLSAGLGDHSRQTSGFVSFLLFASATVAQALTVRMSSRAASLTGLGALPVGALLLTLALHLRSMPALVLAVVVGGTGVGLAFRSGLTRVAALAPPEQRGAVTSTFFVAAYLGITVPVVAAGVLVTTTTLFTATVSLAVFIAALAAVAITILLRRAGSG